MMGQWGWGWDLFKLQLNAGKKSAFLDVLFGILIFHTSSCWIQEEKHGQFCVLSVSVSWPSLIWETQPLWYEELIFQTSSPYPRSS